MSEELELRTFLRQSSQTTTTVTFPPQAEDLDGYSSQRNTAMSLTEELGLSTANIPVRTMEEDFLALLEERDEDKFIEVAGERGLHEDKDATSKFLQLACERHLVKIVEFLLKTDVDPNWVTDETSKTPLRIAVEKGFFKVVELLLEHENIKVEKDLLNELLKRINYEKNEEQNHKRCYKKLLSVGGLDVNYKDTWGNYPLHYATRYGGPEVVLDLLQRKASLSNRSKNEVLTIADCDYSTLNTHFDRCVEVQSGKMLNKKDMTISLDYRTLLPSPKEAPDDKKPSQETAPDDKEKSCLVNSDTNCLMPETDAILYMSKSSELKPLLKHPLITSFLYVKWYRIRWIFVVNLFFYLVFYISLFLFSVTNYSGRAEKSIFPLLLLALTSLLLLFREILQFLVFGKEYICNIENYIEVALIVIVFYELFGPSQDGNTGRQIFSVIILLHSFEYLFLTDTFNSVMLRTVSLNFFRCMFFYFPLIMSFASSFNLLFYVPKRQPSNSTAVQEDEKQEFFVNPLISLFKTIVMLTGDFEVSEINFNQYPVTSHLIFLAFVITVVIILFNLVNNLAVSDIRNEAEIAGHIVRAKYVAHAESMYVFLKKWHVPKKFLSYLPIYLTDYTLFVYPNQKCRVRAEKKPIWGYDYLDEKSVSIAMKLVQTKRLEEDKVLREREESERIQKERDQKLDEVLELLRIQGRSRVD